MTSFRSIIDEWPSLADFAADISVKYVTAQLMRHRNSIASEHWTNVEKAARKRGIRGVSVEVLADLKAQQKKPRPKSRTLSSMSRVG